MSFFNNILSFVGRIKNLFNTKDLNGSIEDFQSRIDIIINDLLMPYASPTELGVNDKFRNLITLIDPKQCNKIAITLSSNLEKNYTKLQLEQFASSILIGEASTPCDDDTCSEDNKQTINNKNGKVSKKTICKSIATHYVKILNLISAILSAVNPSNNMCLNRLNNLLQIIDNDTKQGVSSICNNEDNSHNDNNNNNNNNNDNTNIIVKKNIMLEPGIKQLLMLYYYNMVQDTETEEEVKNILNQYNFLVESFAKLTMKSDGIQSNNMRDVEHNENENMAKGHNNNNNTKQQNNTTINNTKQQNNTGNNNTNPQNNTENTKPQNNTTINNTLYAKQNNIRKLHNNINQYKKEEDSRLNNISHSINTLRTSINEIKNKPSNTQDTNNANTSHPITTPYNINTPKIQSSQNLTKMNQPNAEPMANLEEESSTDDDDSDDDEDDDEDEDEDDTSTDDESVTPPESEPTMPESVAPPEPTMPEPAMPSSSMPESVAPPEPATNTTQPQFPPAPQLPPSSNITTQIPQPSTQYGGANQTKRNNNNIANTNTHNTMKNNSTSTNTNNNNKKYTKTTSDKLIAKFMQFVKNYNTVDKIDDKIITVINSAFKKYNDYNTLDKDDPNYYISSNDFNEFCIKNINTNNNNLINLDLEDERLRDFIKIYKDLKKLYIDNCEYLLVLLEKSILVKESANEKDTETNIHFTLKNIGYSELVEFETDVRNRLVTMYTQCQEHYQRGIMALYKALSEPIQD